MFKNQNSYEYYLILVFLNDEKYNNRGKQIHRSENDEKAFLVRVEALIIIIIVVVLCWIIEAFLLF